MSHPGSSSTAQAWPGSSGPPPSPPAPKKKIPLWVIGVAVAVMLALAGVVLFVLLHDTKSQKQTFPRVWDSRIAPYAKIAEQKRGLLFKHPVEVRFLSPAKFEKSVTTDETELDKDDREDIRQFEGLMRAFGLIDGDVDLFKAFNEASGAGTLAYYSFDDKRITVRGDTLTLAVRATLVHELTHVLQDQYFDLGDRMDAFGKASDKGEDTSEDDVLRAIGEGDANRAEERYRASLPRKQRRALAAAEAKDQKTGRDRLDKVPPIVVTLQSAPYALGDGLVAAVAAKGGNKALDRLFRDPPAHETALFDPFTVLAHDTGAEDVATPKLESGEKKFETGEFGVLTWYFMLAERLPLKDALAAADGWGGDAYVGYERDGNPCARIDYTGRTSADTSRMLSALQRWVAAAPGAAAQVSRHGGLVRFDSCDPGKSVHAGKDVSEDALSLVAVRAYLGVGLVRAGVPTKAAGCLAGKLAQEYPVSKLSDPKFGEGDPAVAQRVRQLAISCR